MSQKSCQQPRLAQQRFSGPGPRRGRSRAQTRSPSPPARSPRGARTPAARGGACSDRLCSTFKAVCHAAGPTPPFQSVQLSVVCTLASPAPPEELATSEHRSAGLLPCSRVTGPWGRSGRWKFQVHSTGCTQRLRPADFRF